MTVLNTRLWNSAAPFPGMPYGAAPKWSFGFMEWTMLLLLLLCAAHAVRKGGRGALPYLLGGFCFGLLLEYIEVLSHSYTYGRFQWMLGHAPMDIPVCIGAGWGIILYTSRLFSDALGMPLTAAAALDTLLALNVDLSMDVVAYRLHMWHWYWTGTGLDPLRAQWFGVPYGNFVGWATVVFCYSAFSRQWEKKLLPEKTSQVLTRAGGESAQGHLAKASLRPVLVAVLALVCSQAVLFSLEAWVWGFLRKYAGLTSGVRLLLVVAAMSIMVALGWRKRTRSSKRVPWLAVLVPCWFHLYFLFCFLWFRLFRENTWMCVAAAVNLGAGVVVHVLPALWREREARSVGPSWVRAVELPGS